MSELEAAARAWEAAMERVTDLVMAGAPAAEVRAADREAKAAERVWLALEDAPGFCCDLDGPHGECRFMAHS